MRKKIKIGWTIARQFPTLWNRNSSSSLFKKANGRVLLHALSSATVNFMVESDDGRVTSNERKKKGRSLLRIGLLFSIEWRRVGGSGSVETAQRWQTICLFLSDEKKKESFFYVTQDRWALLFQLKVLNRKYNKKFVVFLLKSNL